MSTLISIAFEEWRHWSRSRMALWAGGVLAALLITTSLVTVARMDAERQARLDHQQGAEDAFTSQPDRHPHRMVHYGHYLFRLPSPLTAMEPGVDPVTGQAIFLEGHRQNTAAGSEANRSAFLGDLSWPSPALLYQFFVPLLLILLGYAAVVRERENRTLVALMSQGVGGGRIMSGKGLALGAAAALSLLPALVIGGRAVLMGEAWSAVASMLAVYMGYLVLWCVLVLCISSWARTRGAALTSLLALWLVVTLVIPGIAVHWAATTSPSPGKISTDFAMQAELRTMGDGHNASDPAFAAFRDRVLSQYDVDEIEELPVNWRGLVAEHSEAKLTELMNRYAEQRMTQEEAQARAVGLFGWLSPYLAIGNASRTLSGADLATHHRFLREAERVRFDFVQSLNRAHAEQMAYADDINRSRDAAAERRTRISADNWKVLETFEFEPAPAAERIERALPAVAMLALWLAAAAAASVIAARRLGLQ
ncbi:delta 1-pyrroline-5-carboxylate reductase [Acidobacteria bacterium Mor1]|nr:delta 1-pyrroline-5-carboxylate reductase [Acidobacteria bacterium Mor1]